MIVLEVLAAVGCLFWICLALSRVRAWPAEMRLPVGDRPPDEPRLSVVAVVPARNEAALLGRTLPSLLRQRALKSVILVDDDSEDATAELAREIARADAPPDKLRVVAAGPAPARGAGKVHALERGIEAASSSMGEDDWLLLTDADIEHRAGSVRALLERAGDGYDLVSVMARLRAESFWERLLVPTFVYFFQLLYPFRSVAEPGSGVAAAAGGCVLLRRSVLERAGGVAAIRGAVIDDVALAKVVAAAGGRLWLGLDAGIRSLRPYDRLGDLWSMVARSAYDQLGYRLVLLVPVLLGLAIFFVAPPLYAIGGVVAAISGASIGWRLSLWGLVALALQWRALLPVVRHHGLAARYALVLPVSSLLFGAMTISSAWHHHAGRAIAWRGRDVPRRQLPGDGE